MIAEEGLCGQLITIRSFGWQIMACPHMLKGAQYRRNMFSFSIGFVFPEEVDTETFGPVLSKLGRELKTVEEEDCFLSEAANRPRLAEMVRGLYRSMREEQQWRCLVNEANQISLRLFPRLVETPAVLGHHVPILLRDLAQFPKMALSWDPTINLVARYVDGIMHTRRIAEVAHIDPALACNAVRQLVHFGLAAVVDIFQFSNMYVPTPQIGEFMRRRRMQRECVEYVSTDAVASGAAPAPEAADIFRLYCSFRRGLTVRELCERSELLRGGSVGPRRLAVFGVLNGLIRRAYEYPVLQQQQRDRGERPRATAVENEDARRLMDGAHSTDEICVKVNRRRREATSTEPGVPEVRLSALQLIKEVRRDASLVVVLK